MCSFTSRGLIVLLLMGLTGILIPRSAAAQSVPEDDAAALLDRVHQTYDAADGLRATFIQRTRSPFSSDTVALEGSLLLRGTQYRIETPQQTLVTDGTTTWIYNPETNQVIVNDYVNDESVITPDEIFTDYLERYRIVSARTASAEEHALVAIDLTADAASAFYTDATVYVNRDTAMLARVQLDDQNGTTTIFQLDDIQLNPSFPDDAFTFQPPPDADVVDLRS